MCEAMLLTQQERETDDNLTFVRSRLLNSGADLAALLELYRKVWSGKPVADDEANPLVSVLKLSGIVRVAEGVLQVRNRIYARVFDRQWVVQHMPDAELRRQQAAFQRGLARAATVSGAVLGAMDSMALTAQKHALYRQRERYNVRLLRHFVPSPRLGYISAAMLPRTRPAHCRPPIASASPFPR